MRRQANRQVHIDTLNPDDIVERVKATDGAIVTIQKYGNGFSWICHGCGTVGSDGEWTAWVDGTNERWGRTYEPGSLWLVQHDSEWHAKNHHGGVAA